MLINIASRKVAISKALRRFIREQLGARLERFSSAIEGVRVELSDRNGRRGGGDKRCRIHLVLVRGEVVVQDEIRANPRSAFCYAMDRAEKAVHRQLRVAGA